MNVAPVSLVAPAMLTFRLQVSVRRGRVYAVLRRGHQEYLGDGETLRDAMGEIADILDGHEMEALFQADEGAAEPAMNEEEIR